MPALRLAAVGDVHGFFNDGDVEFFNSSDYDLLIFVGDLGGGLSKKGLFERINNLSIPVLVFPGNHDAVHPLHLLAEVKQSDALARPFIEGHNRLRDEWDSAFTSAQITIGGYNRISLGKKQLTVDIICGRPHSMGGPGLAYRHLLKERYGVSSLEDSIKRMDGLVDEATAQNLVFVAHNGPYGLGTSPSDIWGCDFDPRRGDFGDIDLAQSIDYARRQNKRIRAVVAGHMHHKMKGGGHRKWSIQPDRYSWYVNTARVPRIIRQGSRRWHHFVEITVKEEQTEVNQVYFEEKSGQISRGELPDPAV